MNRSGDILTAFVPCRKGSERAPLKNTRPFSGVQDGLIGIKLQQLLATKWIDHIIVSTDDPLIFELCERPEFKSHKRLTVTERPAELATSEATTDSLIKHVPDVIPDGHVLWTQVTSPFIDSALYDALIKTYWDGYPNEYDSLMTVTPIQNFIWNKSGPINYDKTIEKWPLTQTLDPLYIINNAVFIAPAEVYKVQQNKMGDNPNFYELNHIQELDIDWEDDFKFCEALWPLNGKI